MFLRSLFDCFSLLPIRMGLVVVSGFFANWLAGTAGWRSLVRFVFLAAGWRNDTVRAERLDHLTIVIEAVGGDLD